MLPPGLAALVIAPEPAFVAIKILGAVHLVLPRRPAPHAALHGHPAPHTDATDELELGWIERHQSDRAVTITTTGRAGLTDTLGLNLQPIHHT